MIARNDITNLVPPAVVNVSYMLHLLADLWELRAQLFESHEIVLQHLVDVGDGVVQRRRRTLLRLLCEFMESARKQIST